MLRLRARQIRAAAWALLPSAILSASAAAMPGLEGRFQAALLGMVAAVAVGAFATNTWSRVLLLLPAAAILAGGVQVVLGASFGQALALSFLYVAVSVSASGLSALGRRIRAAEVPAGALAAFVLWTAMAGLFWADPAAEALPRPHRRAFRQAVLHVDPALALAYDGVGFDRLRAPAVYFEVPLASSLYERPRATSTGATWIVAGLLAWLLVGALVFVERRIGRGARQVVSKAE